MAKVIFLATRRQSSFVRTETPATHLFRLDTTQEQPIVPSEFLAAAKCCRLLQSASLFENCLWHIDGSEIFTASKMRAPQNVTGFSQKFQWGAIKVGLLQCHRGICWRCLLNLIDENIKIICIYLYSSDWRFFLHFPNSNMIRLLFCHSYCTNCELVS